MMIKTNQPIIVDRAKITQQIASFWDQISEAWQKVWGDHIHHGYYESNHSCDPKSAQERLIQELVHLIEIKPEDHVLDVGCGLGGSSFYLARQYSAKVTGITLSQKQIDMAKRQAKEENIKNVSFKKEDALFLSSFADHSFDTVWSLESCEQFYDKAMFIKQVYRVLKPGGKFLLATWCSSQEEYQGKQAKQYQKLCMAFDLPYMPTIKWYGDLLKQEGFCVTKAYDWSRLVEPSWDVGMSLVSQYTFLQILKMGGWRGLRFAKQIRLMRKAFQQQRVKYGVWAVRKSF